MSAVLSIAVCIAMLFGGTLPAVPATSTNYTVSDIKLTLNDETYEIGPSFSFTEALGSEEMYEHFEALKDGEVILPVSVLLNENELLFSVADRGSAYSVTLDSLELDEETLTVLEQIAELSNSLSDLIAYSRTEEGQAAMLEINAEILSALLPGEYTDEEVDFGEHSFTAKRYEFDLTTETIFTNVLDLLLARPEKEISGFAKTVLDIGNEADGTDYKTFSEIASEEESIVLPCVMTVWQEENEMYLSVAYEMDLLDTKLTETASAFSDGTTIEESVSININSNDINVSENIHINLTGLNSDALSGVLNFDAVVNEVTGTATDENDSLTETYGIMNSLNGTVMIGGTDGCLNLAGTANYVFSNTSVSYDDSGVIIAEDGDFDTIININGSIIEHEKNNYELSVSFDKNNETLASFSCRIDKTEFPYVNSFNDCEVIAFDMAEDSEAMQAFSIDSVSLMSDYFAFMSDEGICALSNKLNESMAGGYDDYAYDDEFGYETEAVEYDTLEEAIDAFDGSLAGYTAPDGFELDSVSVYTDGSFLNAYYTRPEDGAYFQLNAYSESDNYPTRLYSFTENGAEPVGIADIELVPMDEDTISLAKVYVNGSDAVYFYFSYGMDETTALEIVNGMAR